MPARVSFKVTILTLFSVLTLGLSGAVLYVSYERNSETALRTAEKLLEQAAARIVATTDALIEPLFNVTNSAVLLPGVTAMGGAKGEHELAPIMLGVLQRYPQMVAVYMGNGRGDFYRIVSLASLREESRHALSAPPQAAFAVQTI